MNSTVILSVKTRNVNRFLKGLYKLNIEVLSVEIINYKELRLEINEDDIDKVKKLSVLNEINVIDYKGKIKRKNVFLYNKTFFISLLIGTLILIFLSNVIFSIEVSHSNKELREFIISELKNNGIHTFQLRKNFKNLEKVKNKILEDNKSKLEWLEIERIGTKYIVKVEERIINSINKDNRVGDIISTHDAVIKKIIVEKGVKVKEVNDYVKKGETIISGSIYLNEEIKEKVKAIGEVYGEVWYKLSVEYPVIDDKREETGSYFDTYSFNFFNKTISIKKNLYNLSYKKSNIIIKNDIIPISITKDRIYELKPISGIYTEGEALLNAKEYANKKMSSLLKKDEYIIGDKVLNYKVNSNTIYIDVFYKVYINITGFKEG